MKSEIKVIVAEDHDLYRDGLTNLLLATAGMHFCGSAGNGEELVALVRQNRPDVIITDLMMPVMDGIEAIREIMKMEPPHPVILVLSTFDSERFIIDALVAGAHGYVIKNAAREEIIEAIRTINEGDYYFCKSTSPRMIKHIVNSTFNLLGGAQLPIFSELEKKVIRLVCEEKSSDEIKALLFLSKRTVDRLRGNIMKKMKVRSTIGLVIYAVKNGLYTIE